MTSGKGKKIVRERWKMKREMGYRMRGRGTGWGRED
jgi:hypothetical protein